VLDVVRALAELLDPSTSEVRLTLSRGDGAPLNAREGKAVFVRSGDEAEVRCADHATRGSRKAHLADPIEL
jgi:hypothetical protein